MLLKDLAYYKGLFTMKNKLILYLPLFFLFISIQGTLADVGYGLQFNSLTVSGDRRTSLFLNDNAPIDVKNNISIEFDMLVRDEPDFGSILHICNNDKPFLHFVFASGENNRNYPALVCNDDIYAVNTEIKKNIWIPVALDLNVKKNNIHLRYGAIDTTLVILSEGIDKVSISFGGLYGFSSDVAPINIKNIRILRNGKSFLFWKLGKHDGDICYDEIQKALARAHYPSWLIDSHFKWSKLYSEKSNNKIDVTFDAKKALFYLVKSNKVETLNGTSGKISSSTIKGGFPAMEYIDHMAFDTLNNRVISYSLNDKKVSFLPMSDMKWSLSDRNVNEPKYYNHARSYSMKDSCFYLWGGYGFYHYRNNLFRLNVVNGNIEEVKYSPIIGPRYSSAACVVGEELFIFGGRGNKYGRQEISSEYYYELYSINLRTGKSRLVWKNDGSSDPMLMASSMYYEPADNSFYAVSLKNGGRLLKVYINEPKWTEISMPINNNIVYQDCDISFYSSPYNNKLYLVVNKILNDHTYNLCVYYINTPLLNGNDILQRDETNNNSYILIISCLFFIFLVLYTIVFYRRRKRINAKMLIDTSTKRNTDSYIELPQQEDSFSVRSKSSISLLGTFKVRDKKGTDITYNFTPRLKNLLILLVLYSVQDNQGISTNKVTEFLWSDKDDLSARNNRNVSMRKLRILLESVGKIDVTSNLGFMRIEIGDDVYCDYKEAISLMKKFKEKGGKVDSEIQRKILEVMLYGPLLTNTIFDWLDEFKNSYSSLSIDILKNILDMEIESEHYDTILHISDILFLHDPFNEDALAAKCSVLFRQGKKGISKSVYDRFCKEYKESFGENFNVPLSNLYK